MTENHIEALNDLSEGSFPSLYSPVLCVLVFLIFHIHGFNSLELENTKIVYLDAPQTQS